MLINLSEKLNELSNHKDSSCCKIHTNADVTSQNPDSNISVIDIEIVKEVENRLLKMFEEDKKLVNPVFLFVHNMAISKLAYFLALNIKRPVALGIAGTSASGKSTFVFDIIEAITEYQEKFNLNPVITRVNTDDYYYDRSEGVKAAGGISNFAKNYDFDIPEAFELSLLKNHIEQLVLGNNVWLPKYNMDGSAVRQDNQILAMPNKIIISEGLFNLSDNLKDVFDICVYVDVSPEVQSARWFERAKNRDFTGEAAQRVYNNATSKAEIYVKPSKNNADFIVNGEALRESYKSVANQFIEIVEYAHSARFVEK